MEGINEKNQYSFEEEGNGKRKGGKRLKGLRREDTWIGEQGKIRITKEGDGNET